MHHHLASNLRQSPFNHRSFVFDRHSLAVVVLLLFLVVVVVVAFVVVVVIVVCDNLFDAGT